MLKFTAKFNTLSFASFEKVCAVLKNNGWTFPEEPVFMFGEILRQVSGCIDSYCSVDTLSMEQH